MKKLLEDAGAKVTTAAFSTAKPGMVEHSGVQGRGEPYWTGLLQLPLDSPHAKPPSGNEKKWLAYLRTKMSKTADEIIAERRGRK